MSLFFNHAIFRNNTFHSSTTSLSFYFCYLFSSFYFFFFSLSLPPVSFLLNCHLSSLFFLIPGPSFLLYFYSLLCHSYSTSFSSFYPCHFLQSLFYFLSLHVMSSDIFFLRRFLCFSSISHFRSSFSNLTHTIFFFFSFLFFSFSLSQPLLSPLLLFPLLPLSYLFLSPPFLLLLYFSFFSLFPLFFQHPFHLFQSIFYSSASVSLFVSLDFSFILPSL